MRMTVCSMLWERHIYAEFSYKSNPKLKETLAYADDHGIPFVVLFGQNELAENSVKVNLYCLQLRRKRSLLMFSLLLQVKDMSTGQEEKIPVLFLADMLQERVASLTDQLIVRKKTSILPT